MYMNKNQPLNCVLASARTAMIKATNDIMKEYSLPASLMDGILSSLLADIRSQINLELVKYLNGGENNVN